MRALILGMGLTILCAPALAERPVVEDPLLPLINKYEAFAAEADPSSRARNAGVSPRQWSDVRPETLAARADQARALMAKIERADTERATDRAILLRLLQSDINDYDYDLMRIPFVGDWGFQAEPIFASRRTRIRSAEDAEAWTARLNDVPRYFNEHINNMRRGVETGYTAHKDPLGTTMDQIAEQITDKPEDSALYLPFENLPDSISEPQAMIIRAKGRVAVKRAIQAYRDTLMFLETEYEPNVREGAGIADLPGGKAYYRAAVEHFTAGAGYSVGDVHKLGRSEVARIRAEMDTIIKELEFDGTFDEFLTYLRTDPGFYADTPDDLMREARDISKRLDAVLPRYFNLLPRLPYGVSPVPADIAPGYTTGRYSQGDPIAGIAGTYLVNTYALDQRPLYELPALSAHEAVPGHHLQIALAQEQTGVPEFRKSYYATAFGEGWGLYAERLAGEAGIYETPYERFGALSYEMWRACRLVADTGLHYYGWSREEAEECFTNNSALAPLNIETEVTRYIGWPGQATAYKVGELKILELRARAEKALGEDFDIRKFHDAILGEGAVPLDILDSNINDWIKAQKDTEIATPQSPSP